MAGREVVHRILLKHGPMSSEELAPLVGITKISTDANLRRLKKYNAIKKAGERKGRPHSSRPVIVWEAIPDETD